MNYDEYIYQLREMVEKLERFRKDPVSRNLSGIIDALEEEIRDADEAGRRAEDIRQHDERAYLTRND